MPKKEQKIRRNRHGPEWYIQNDLVRYLKDRGWLVERIIGNALQNGLPDLYSWHPKYAGRWIDVKVEGQYEFTPAQRHKWPLWESFGLGIWILTGANQQQYDRLFAPANMRDYWKEKYNLPSIDEAIDELAAET